MMLRYNFFINKALLFLSSAKSYSAFVYVTIFTILFTGCHKIQEIETENNNDQIIMFDGKTLDQWQIADYVEGGNIYVKDNCIYIEKSQTNGYMQGITWTGPLMSMNYEITLEAMPIEGSDFFCGLTFPVVEQPCTLIIGGWGGSLIGLSSLDYMDASENETTTFMDFELNQWYKIRLKVTDHIIQAWIDDELVIEVDITNRYIDIRFECMPCLPLGIATYRTTSAIKDIKMKKLTDKEIEDMNLFYQLHYMNIIPPLVPLEQAR